jgi:hypothetical protein
MLATPHSSSRPRSIPAVFSWMSMRWVSRSHLGWSLAASATGNTAHAVRATASWPYTSRATVWLALGGLAGVSGRLLSEARAA